MKTAATILGFVSAALAFPSLRDEVNALMIVSDPTDCIKQHCPNEYQACLNKPQCIPDIQACQQKCGTKTSCWQLCLASKGDNEAINLAKCAASNHCLGEKPAEDLSKAVALMADPIECVKEKCPNEYEKCEKDPKCIPTIQECQKKCGTKQSCWEFCLAGKGDSAATNVAKCAAANHCI